MARNQAVKTNLMIPQNHQPPINLRAQRRFLRTPRRQIHLHASMFLPLILLLALPYGFGGAEDRRTCCYGREDAQHHRRSLRHEVQYTGKYSSSWVGHIMVGIEEI